MTRRALSLALLVALLLSGVVPSTVDAADPPLPDSMAAVGDSISRAASTGGTLGADYPANAWSTGTNATVNSHYLRLLALGAPISGQNHNRAVSGAKMVDLDGQMANVVSLQPDLVTVLMGGNDLCTDTVAQMTMVTTFRSQFEAAMSRVMTETTANVYVVSIPDVYQLWNLFKNNWWARFIWSTADICQSLLANPTSTQAADVQRRADVRQRNIDYNTQLAQVCATYGPRCRFDGNAVFNTKFATSDVSGDYFHPSTSGQAKLAAVSWAAGYTWAQNPPPNEAPTADFSFDCVELTCSFTDASADDVGIASRSWTFGDGSSSAATDPSHTYGADGTYSVTLTVTDTGGLTDSITRPVSVAREPDPPAEEFVTVASLTPASQSSGKNTWTATVTILVTGPGGGGVADATVTGSWSVGAGDTCTTGADGRCAMTSDNLNRRKVGSVTLTITDVSHATYSYVDPQPLPSVSVAQPG